MAYNFVYVSVINVSTLYQHFDVPNTEKLCACVSVFNGKAKYAYMNISAKKQNLDVMS